MKLIMTLFSVFSVSVVLLQCEEKNPELSPKTVQLKSVDDILPIDSNLVRPVLYQNVPAFDQLPVNESKEKFIAAVLPAILIAKHQVEQEKKALLQLKNKTEWSPKDSAKYLLAKEKLGAKNFEGLLSRMITLPTSIVLAQAAVESGWGSSRFFREGNNLFGIWSYNRNEPRMEALYDRGETSIYLRKYSDISSSIIDYFETLGSSFAYKELRSAKSRTSEASELLPYLKYYSERREAYVNQLRTIIDQNNLYQYDRYEIDPAYFVTE